MKLIFMKNVCSNKVVTTKKENHEKIRKLIDQNSSFQSYKNIKLTELYQRFKDSARGKDSETCEKRKYFNLSDSEPSVKSRKYNEKTDLRKATDSRGGRIQDSETSSSQRTSEIPWIYDRFAILSILTIMIPFKPSELPWSSSNLPWIRIG